MKIIKTTLLVTSLLISSIANTALYDRGNGMIYDSSLNITWLQDANYAKTSGYGLDYDGDGFMRWDESTLWAGNLVYGGYSDWRLPSAGLIGNNAWSYDGSTDSGYSNNRSEIGHLFLELGNRPYCNAAGDCTHQDNGCSFPFLGGCDPGYGWSNSGFIDTGTNQNVSFLNVFRGYIQWEAEAVDGAYPPRAWGFSTHEGNQNAFYSSNIYMGSYGQAWAVRDGDVLHVNEVPLPASGWLLLSSLGLLFKLRASTQSQPPTCRNPYTALHRA